MIQLRPIHEPDLEQVNEVFAEAFDSPAQPIEYIANLCYTEPEGCLVATLAGEIVGYACAHRSGRIGYIGNLGVRASHRGKGYGKAVTIAVRDHLAARCDVVGLAVDPYAGRNLNLYASCGFEATLPSCHLCKPLPAGRDARRAASILTARELGDRAPAAIAQIGSWTGDVLPGLDFTRDLEHFAHTYPERLWIAFGGDAACGFLAYHELFRGDPWGAVRPGPNDTNTLDTLVEAMEASVSEETLWFHVHTNFPRVLEVLRDRGYRMQGHRTCMVLKGDGGVWPHASDSLFARPWWT